MPDLTILNGYLSLADMQAAIGDHTEEHEAEHVRAILAASRKIDTWTGRYFYQDTTATPRMFRAEDPYTICTGDFDATDDVTVAVDGDKDGVFETVWTADDWQAEPFVRYNGFPYTQVTTTTRTKLFPVDGRRPRVQVTAKWGWGVIPGPVAQATQILATLYFRLKDASGVTIGLDTSREKVSSDPVSMAIELIRDYWVPGGDPEIKPPGDCCD